MQMFTPGAHNLKTVSLHEKPLGPVNTWSFSSLKKHEECNYRSQLKKEGFKEESGPAAERGTKVHEVIEHYIQGISTELHFPRDLKVRINDEMTEDIANYREAYAAGNARVEEEWSFRRDWSKTAWDADDAWGRAKLDYLGLEGNTSAIVRDWKTGRSQGNEVKHGEQAMFYAIKTMLWYPEVQFVETQFFYLDEGKKGLPKKWTRNDVGIFLPRIEQRALKMTTATHFPPNPSKWGCKWCKYKTMQREDGSPVCPYAPLE